MNPKPTAIDTRPEPKPNSENATPTAHAKRRLRRQVDLGLVTGHDLGLARVLRGFERTFNESHRAIRQIFPMKAAKTRT